MSRVVDGAPGSRPFFGTLTWVFTRSLQGAHRHLPWSCFAHTPVREIVSCSQTASREPAFAVKKLLPALLGFSLRRCCAVGRSNCPDDPIIRSPIDSPSFCQ